MERAIQEGRIGFSLQTIASVAQEGDPLYAECLGRIIRSDGVVLTADELLENPGVIESIAAFERHMIVLAFEWLALHSVGNLGCGISTSMLSSERDRQAVLDILIANKVMASRLVIELKSEDAEFSIGLVQDFCETVRRLGYRVAFDGFGAGYATPEMLFALPFDIVKIDAFSFAATGGKARQVLFHMASLASCVTPIVVLKGVETYDQLETARAIGVTHVQGFLLSEPTLVPEFASGMPQVRVSHGQLDTLH
jgi:EAL domain-containing protein (putative c-di-GMP-specific phosphodiesterase class I)